MPATSNRLIRAAGGVVWRSTDKREVAVVRRNRHRPDECCLPKGKLDAGETWQAAALREVLEETGCAAAISGFADAVYYLVDNAPKIVVFFEMVALREGEFQPSGEVCAVEWLEPQAALERLTHNTERKVLQNACNPVIGASAGSPW